MREQHTDWGVKRQTYSYEVEAWLNEGAGDQVFTPAEFFGKVVPEKGKSIRLVQCFAHPGNLHLRAIMWNGSIQVLPFLYDNTYGRGDRDPAFRAEKERIRKKGGKLFGD